MASTLPSPVCITIEHGSAVVDPAVPSLMAALTVQVREYEVAGPIGCRAVIRKDSLYEKGIASTLVIRPGLVARAADILCRHGFTVQIEDRRVWPMGLRGVGNLALTDAVNPDICRLLKANPLGQFILPRNQTVEIIADIARTFLTASILILAPRRQDAWGLWHSLKDQLDEYVGLRVGKTKRLARVVVGVIPPVKYYDPTGADVIILANAEELTGRNAIDKIVHASWEPTRVYAMVSRPQALAHRRRLVLEGLAGPVIYPEAVGNAKPLTPVYRFVPPPGPVINANNAYERRRDGIWLNDHRNDIVAAVAIAAASGDTATLWESGLLLDQDENVLQGASVAVLVENSEHGRQLLQRLPGWVLRTIDMDFVSARTFDEENENSADNPYQIITLRYVAEHGVNSDLLIDATGGSVRPIQWPEGPGIAKDANAGQRISIGTAVIQVEDQVEPRNRQKQKSAKTKAGKGRNRTKTVKGKSSTRTRKTNQRAGKGGQLITTHQGR